MNENWMTFLLVYLYVHYLIFLPMVMHMYINLWIHLEIGLLIQSDKSLLQYSKKVTSFPSHLDHKIAPISDSVALSQAPGKRHRSHCVAQRALPTAYRIPLLGFKRQICVNSLPLVTLDSTAAGNGTRDLQSQVQCLTTMPHTKYPLETKT